MVKAKYYETLEEDKVKCLLCPHKCIIAPGKRGICKGRVNKAGILYTENYAQISSIGLDPIEKKPLYHFYPGSRILSIGTFGCNFSCEFCQNWQISQQSPALKKIIPEEMISLALNNDLLGIAYTYSEPSVWYEYILETSRLAHHYNLKNVLVTNGFINQDPLKDLIPYIDAVNIDLKSFSDDFYRQLCSGRLKPVLENIKFLVKKVHLELTTLIIPELNDSTKELEDLFSWIEGIESALPLHLTRYFPRYKLKKQATSVSKIEEAYHLAKKHLDYVYIGNINLGFGRDTYCPKCHEPVIIREEFDVKNRLKNGKCPFCGGEIKGIY